MLRTKNALIGAFFAVCFKRTPAPSRGAGGMPYTRNPPVRGGFRGLARDFDAHRLSDAFSNAMSSVRGFVPRAVVRTAGLCAILVGLLMLPEDEPVLESRPDNVMYLHGA